MNIFQLQCFLAVANSLSFVQSSQQMKISQPAITHQIKSLESELNTKLFLRSTRLVELTPEGRTFLPDAKNIVAVAEQAKLRFASSEDQPVEVLSLGCSSYMQLLLLTETLHALRNSHPKLHPQLQVVPHDQLFHLLKVDMVSAVLDIQSGAEEKEKMVFRELIRSDLVCVCREDCSLAERDCLSLSELADQPLIFCDPVTMDPEIAKLQWKLTENRAPAELHFCASIEAAAILAGAGIGAAVLPDILVPSQPGIAKIKLSDVGALSFGLFYKPYSKNAILKEFIQCAREAFQQPPLTATISQQKVDSHF